MDVKVMFLCDNVAYDVILTLVANEVHVAVLFCVYNDRENSASSSIRSLAKSMLELWKGPSTQQLSSSGSCV